MQSKEIDNEIDQPPFCSIVFYWSATTALPPGEWSVFLYRYYPWIYRWIKFNMRYLTFFFRRISIVWGPLTTHIALGRPMSERLINADFLTHITEYFYTRLCLHGVIWSELTFDLIAEMSHRTVDRLFAAAAMSAVITNQWRRSACGIWCGGVAPSWASSFGKLLQCQSIGWY